MMIEEQKDLKTIKKNEQKKKVKTTSLLLPKVLR
jgi:hypothetical protein